jgi:mono/diheme cytochrome c family protein
MKLALLVALGLAAGCAPAAPVVTPRHAEWAMAQWPSSTQADLERGRTLFVQKCSSCHRPPSPTDHAPADWPAEVAEMKERAHLGLDEVMLIERYVVTVASLK